MSDLTNLEFVNEQDAGAFDDDFVRRTENMIGLEFEPSFLEFTKRHNGGTPKKKYFKMGERTKVLETFLGFVPDYKTSPYGGLDIGVVWSQIDDRLNEYLVPFAAVYAGDFLCFDYEDGKPPKVVLWIHELSEEEEPVTEPIAASFEQFLKMLTDEKK
ncbi:MAG TPA: SMI1/KNR4 family protein [Pyrinomonadaceae bacterium]|jgi:hypothetical protein